ncbi:MAG: hypothetical protein KDB60_12815, partial [Propionibacteriaceae bacterium]|nr:hypothetical protein [Propionibacteriaceae bacterium]
MAVDVSVLPVRPSRLMLRTRLWRRHLRSHRPAPLGAARPGLVRTQRSAQHVPFPRARTGAVPRPAPLGAGRGPDRPAP